MSGRSWIQSLRIPSTVVCLCGWLAPADSFAQQVSLEQVLKYRPSQADVDYETPTEAELPQCKVEVEKEAGQSGWVVLGPQGQTIRRFVDSDGNGFVDQYRYYQHGLEVYRDVDSDGDKKVDQYRWMNTAGTRWGADTNADGKIDRWLRLSAEEASREAIRAMASGDVNALAALFVNAGDLRQLEVSKEIAEKMLQAVSAPDQKLRALAGSKVLTPSTRWIRFDTSMLMPSVIPKEAGKAGKDLEVYENVMAIVETGGETAFVHVGEMVRVGDTWKLTGIPKPLEGNTLEVTDSGLLLQPSLASNSAAGGAVNLTPEVQKLIEDLRQLDESAPKPDASAAQVGRYNVARAQLLGQLAKASGTSDEREQWLRQQIDGITAATQMNAFPDGLPALQSLEQEIVRAAPQSELAAYVSYRRMLAEYNTRLLTSKADQRGDVQTWWLTSLESFVKAHPKSEDAADALLQLGITNELSGNVAEARKWYEQLASQHRAAPSAGKATGALRRLNLVGKPLALSGAGLTGGTIDTAKYQGKVLLVIYWWTGCQPCTEDLPQIKALYQKYNQQGFEVIGVNLDSPGAPIREYLQQYQVPWPQIYEEGGLESRPAIELGIISLPTMLLVDHSGKVESVSASVDHIKEKVPQLLKAAAR